MKFTEEHEWLESDGDMVKVGITEYAAEQLGDIVFIELPDVGISVTKGQEIVVIESCLLYTSPSPRDRNVSRLPSSA